MNQPALYNKIGINYNATRRADKYLTERFRKFLLPQSGEKYLDIGCGTGNYTCALASEDYKFYGIDPSETMLEKAREKNCNVIWQNAVAEKLPFENNFFAGAIASLTIHHWLNLTKGFQEISRVLNKNGDFVLFTSLPEQTAGYWLAEYFPKMIQDSAEKLPSLEKIEEALSAANLKMKKRGNYFVRDDLEDLFLYSGKHRPELYLREEIRSGISSFSNPANSSEVEEGLQQLSEDIERGIISEVIEKYKNDIGDYVLLSLKKIKIYKGDNYYDRRQKSIRFKKDTSR